METDKAPAQGFTFIKVFEHSFKENWSLNALSDYGTNNKLTYGEFAKRIARLHTLFRMLGVQEGSKIAVCGKDNVTWVTVYMATVTYGAVVVPILPDFNPTDIAHIVNHSESELLFISNSIWEQIVPDSLLNIKGVISLDKQECLYSPEGSELPKALRLLSQNFRKAYPAGFGPEHIVYSNRSDDEIAEINYTSGTTGFSKGVMLRGGNLNGNIAFGVTTHLHYKKSRALSFLPLAHAYGCAFDMLTPLAVGADITILGKTPAPRILLKAFSEVRPQLVICVPLILEKIYKNMILPLISKKSMRWALAVPFFDTLVYSKIRKRLVDAFGGEFEEVIVGGAPLNKEVEEFLHKIKFPFTVGYGMTECGPLISYTPWNEFQVGSSGRILPEMEVMILSDDPQNDPGEICVRGRNVMKGYFRNPQATEDVLSEDGWLKTGDMGVCSEDGTIFIRGRSKTMILSANGQNIYPEEIESKFNNIPLVAESLVVERDCGLTALVYPDYDVMDRMGLTLDDLQPTLEEIREKVNTTLAAYEQVRRIIAMPTEFQKTPKRSIKRFLYTH